MYHRFEVILETMDEKKAESFVKVVHFFMELYGIKGSVFGELVPEGQLIEEAEDEKDN